MSHVDVCRLYRDHAAFVRRTLARFGVPDADRDDQLHEVFLVVQRRLDDFAFRGPVRSWLYGIARRVASTYRRRERRCREHACDDPYFDLCAPSNPEWDTERALARAHFARIVLGMSAPQRDAFVLHDVVGLTGRAIASAEGCPMPTVFSRLARARAHYDAEVRRLRLADRGAFARRMGSVLSECRGGALVW